MAVIKEGFNLNGNWAIILGGSSGMGLAAAERLSADGMNICIIHRDGRVRMKSIELEFENIRNKGVKLLSFNLDASSLATISAVIDALSVELLPKQKVHLLLHSVAKGNLKPMFSNQDEPILNVQDFQLTIESMALNWYQWTQSLITANLFSKDARVLALTSEGNQKAWSGYGAVSAAKATLEALCRNMALEFAPLGLRCNVIQAGITDTPSLRRIPGSEIMMERAKKRNPFKRLTEPKDVANVISLLCSDRASWINGAIIPVDGGERIV